MINWPYRNMTYEDAVTTIRRIYKILYPRRFHSYNSSLPEPFSDFVGIRGENAKIPEEYDTLNGMIGNVMNKYLPIAGDDEYTTSDVVESIPEGQMKIILDLHGIAIINSLLEIAELGLRYISTIQKQIDEITNGATGSTPTAVGNRFALSYLDLFNNINSKFTATYGIETFERIKTMLNFLSSATSTGVVVKNINHNQVGQEEVISDAFDKDYLNYFMLFLEAENTLHDKVLRYYKDSVYTQRDTMLSEYKANKGKVGSKQTDVAKKLKKFPRYIDVSGCRSSCVGLCISSCSSACYGCTDKCSGQCTAKCADCSAGCMQQCENTCQGSCRDGCSGCKTGCVSGCYTGCSSECGGECKNMCHTDCEGSCYGETLGFASSCAECGTMCKGTCGNSCEDTTSAINPAPDPKPITQEITPKPVDPPIITPQEVTPTTPNKPTQGDPGGHPTGGWVTDGDGVGHFEVTTGTTTYASQTTTNIGMTGTGWHEK